jgi:hypothetical protein
MSSCPAAAVAAQEPPDEKNASALGGLNLCNNWIFVYGEDGGDCTVVIGMLDPELLYLNASSWASQYRRHLVEFLHPPELVGYKRWGDRL